MTKIAKISLGSALLININIIVGAGLFLNIKPLTALAGPFGFFGYALGALTLFPFVFTLAKLAQANPVAGGFFAYGKKYLSPFMGFLSGWSYFVGKTVSAAFLSYAFTSFFQKHISFLKTYPTLLLTTIVIITLLAINIAGVHIGGKIQVVFFSMKLIPIVFAIVFGIMFFQTKNITLEASLQHLANTISTVPVALYALMGFEITCAIGHLIAKPEKNIFRSIVYSFVAVAITYTVFQGALYASLGNDILLAGQPFTKLANKFFVSTPLMGQLITSLVFAAVISGAFGILTSNCWNLHALAKDKFLPGSTLLIRVSRKNIPWVSLIFQGALAVLFLAISKNQIALQSMSVFGVVASFLVSALAALYATKKQKLQLTPWASLTAIASCCYILFLCFQKIANAGVSLPYIFVLAGGIGLGVYSSRTNKLQ